MSQNVGQFLTRRTRRDPNVEAVFEPATGRRLSYQELNSRSNQVAHALVGLGLEHGDRVGLLLMNGAEFVETFFGAGKVGLVNVPLNWRLVADELEFIVGDAGAKAMVYSEEFAEVVAELKSRGDKTAVEHWIQVGGTPAEGCLSYDDWAGAASADEPEAAASGDDLLFIMYTSGTTGLPKGVMHSHETVLWATFTIAATSDMRHKDRFLNCLPLFHVGALSPVISAVYSGGSVTLMKAFDPTASWEIIRDEKIDSTLMVPAMLQFMLLTFDKDAHDTTTLRWVMSGAAPVPKTLIETYAAMDIELSLIHI